MFELVIYENEIVWWLHMRPSATFWGGWRCGNCRKTLNKSSLLLWVKVCFEYAFIHTHPCLILTHSVSPGSLSCQSHPPCLWKYYSKWNAQATGCSPFSAAVGLIDLLAEPTYWVAVGKDCLVQLFLLVFFLFLILFFSISCVCCKSLTLSGLNNPDGSHDLMMFLIMGQRFTVFSKIWEN